MHTTFAAYLKHLRLHQNLSLREVSRRAGIGQSTLSRWEQGQFQPRLPELIAVLHALGASPAQEQEAIALLAAPRALRHLHQTEEQTQPDFLEAAGAMPAGGDLLRAMRLRRGWTQAQLASAIGVTQGRVAHWERSEEWPSAERLHGLCYTLGAQGEELAALASGALSTGRLLAGNADEADLWTQLHGLWLVSEEMLDVTALAWIVRLWSEAVQQRSLAQQEEARFQLTYTYCVYTHRLAETGRWKQANVYAWRALELTRQGYLRHYSDHVLAILSAASAAEQGGTPRHLRQALQILSGWEESVQYPIYQGLLLSRMGTYLARSGQQEEALQLCQDACHITARMDSPWDLLLRKRDYAETLAQVGRYGQALEVLESTAALSEKEEAMRAVHLLSGARYLLELGQIGAAQEQLHAGLELVEAHHLHSLEAQVRELSRRL